MSRAHEGRPDPERFVTDEGEFTFTPPEQRTVPEPGQPAAAEPDPLREDVREDG